MVHLLVKTTSDGYDSTSWLVGAYSDKSVAEAEKVSRIKERELLEQQIKEADEREDTVWVTWESEGLRQKYLDEGLSDSEIEGKYDQDGRIARNGVQDYLWDDIVWYKIVPVEVDSDHFERKIL